MHASNPETIYSAGSGDLTQARVKQKVTNKCSIMISNHELISPDFPRTTTTTTS